MEQASKHNTIDGGARGSIDLALHEKLMPQRQDLDVLIPVAHRQQAQKGERVGHGEVGQTQQHDRP
ncbi:hypothetical protein [Streptomyces rhizosphaericus]|uniref:Uncharacterized protein n=1 Tax=Streptomyces rhizosphaericus TaxID=114699 RepID=A0A6G4AVV6_9ACTN|nr:hypothetical protein [Streptomyces rhizosphaericus]NEW77378.1 hypothetical protein [Streptomyces rhizosphaericus]